MLFRYRARNFPDSLSAEEMSRWTRWRAERWAARGGRQAVVARANELMADASPAQQVVLQDLLSYLQALSADAT